MHGVRCALLLLLLLLLWLCLLPIHVEAHPLLPTLLVLLLVLLPLPLLLLLLCLLPCHTEQRPLLAPLLLLLLLLLGPVPPTTICRRLQSVSSCILLRPSQPAFPCVLLLLLHPAFLHIPLLVCCPFVLLLVCTIFLLLFEKVQHPPQLGELGLLQRPHQLPHHPLRRPRLALPLLLLSACLLPALGAGCWRIPQRPGQQHQRPGADHMLQR
jgi:hypothetical protein